MGGEFFFKRVSISFFFQKNGGMVSWTFFFFLFYRCGNFFWRFNHPTKEKPQPRANRGGARGTFLNFGNIGRS